MATIRKLKYETHHWNNNAGLLRLGDPGGYDALFSPRLGMEGHAHILVVCNRSGVVAFIGRLSYRVNECYMEAHRLKQIFPRASKGFIQINSHSGVGLQNPVPKPDTTDALDSKKERKRTSHDRVTVCVTSYRTRLLDLDNVHGGQKFLLDCLTECKLIRDDNPESIELTVRQEKVKHRWQEKTVVELTT